MAEARSKAKVALGGAVSVALAVLLLINGLFVARNCSSMRAPQQGAEAPAFSLKTIEGKTVSLQGLRGEVVLVDFWAIWCRPCVAKFPLLESLADQYGARGLRVLAVNVERSPTSVRNLSRRRKQARKGSGKGPAALTYLLDDGKASFSFGVQSLPHLVLIGRDGRVVYQHRGGGGADALRQQVQKALAQPHS